jgi:adenylate cyclase
VPSIISGYEYDIFISYRHKDNKGGHWVTEFVEALKIELESTFKEEVSVYFDENQADGLLETYHVSKSLEGKLRCLIFIPVISQTYCDLKSFAWLHEFCAFNRLASNDSFGRDIKLLNGNVASRILPVKINVIDAHDQHMIETEVGGVLRSIDFIYKSSGVNRPLKRDDMRSENNNNFSYRDQINKLANAIKEIIGAMRNTPSSSQLSEPVLSAPAPIKKRNKIPVIISATLFILILLSSAVYYFFILRSDQFLDKSIAVLPFIDLSQEHDLEYFSDGMMEEILNHLAKIEDLRVISRTSSMQYKGAKKSVTDIAKELNVTNILEGSVRKSGDRVRITVQLIDAATEKHLWSEDYDYLELKDIFAVQSDVSIRVAEILKAKLTDPVKASLKKNYTNDLQAYKFYVKGRYYWDKRTEQSFDSAEVYFKHAIEIDPQYALAYAGLADCYVIDIRTMSGLESIAIATSYVDKALSLDSTLGEAWATMALIKSREYDWEGSKKTFAKAIQLNPNYPVAYFFYGNVFFYTGDLQRGIKENKKALDLDPLSYPLNQVLGNHYVMTREYDLAIQQGLRFKAIFNYAPSFLGLSLLEERKYQEAIQIFAHLPVSAVTHGLLLSYGYSKSGDKTKAKEELDKTLEQKGIRSYFWLAVAYIGLENYDLALTQLEKGYEMRDFAMNTIKVNPLVDPLRNEPRFKALLKKMNLD